MSDYEYSDSFISDEDDAPRATKSTGARNTRKYKPGKYTLKVIRRQNMSNRKYKPDQYDCMCIRKLT